MTTTSETPKKNVRADILAKANAAVNGDRNNDYGDPTQDFARTARYWNEHLIAVFERRTKGDPELEGALDYLVDLISSSDVAIMMMLLKVSRLSWSPDKEDHWLDIAGYAACGAQCADQDFRFKGGLR